jgi:hypothetical protein
MLFHKAVDASRSIHDEVATQRYVNLYKKALANYPGMRRSAGGDLEAVIEAAQEKLVILAVVSGPNSQGFSNSSTSQHSANSVLFDAAMQIYIVKVMIIWIKKELKSGALSVKKAASLLKVSHLFAGAT